LFVFPSSTTGYLSGEVTAAGIGNGNFPWSEAMREDIDEADVKYLLVSD
jgi:hypothetical protein